MRPDPNLAETIRRSHEWWQQLSEGQAGSINGLAEQTSLDASDITRFLPLVFLAPDIVEAIFEGRQPVELNVKRLRKLSPIPTDWNAQ
ncbi:MAG: hypothetical protein MI741_23575, partial [Rhodospirillales bacterium]|nr:hypothetical protein [Rhodospirillales bacterium]